MITPGGNGPVLLLIDAVRYYDAALVPTDFHSTGAVPEPHSRALISPGLLWLAHWRGTC